MALIKGSSSSSYEEITGTAEGDTIDHGYGPALIDGGGGTDTVVYFANSADFSMVDLSGILRIQPLNGQVRGEYGANYWGTVELRNVEKAQFLDKTITLPPATSNNIIKASSSSSYEEITGTAEDDTIDHGYGPALIDGGGGTDTVVYFANSADFSMVDLSGILRIQPLNGQVRGEYGANYWGTVELRNIEKVQFLDKTLAFGSNSVVDPFVDDYSNSINTTGAIAVGGTVTGNIETTGDTDWFKVTLVGGQCYKFDLEGSASGVGTLSDSFLRLRDNTGTPVSLAFDDDSGVGLNAFFTFSAPTTGVYFLAAGSGADDGDGTGTYKMSVKEISPSTSFGFPLGNLDAQGRRMATEANDGDGLYVASNFGVFVDPTGSANDYHLGEDWNFESGATDLGAPVYPVADGVVVWAEPGGSSWGNVVIIKHPLSSGEYGGYVTSMYGHLGSLLVSKGDSVSKNNPIGVIGPAEGISTGPHLHLEIRTSDNPNALVPGAGYSMSQKPSGWLDPTDFISNYSLSITNPPSSADRIFNWAENTYGNLFPNQSTSQELIGYYARIYENGNALGEQNDNIFFYDGSSITLVGRINDFLTDAIAAGF